ncbi:MAG: hypothetical protein KOO63_08025 [Bacteroidales bacterium]|nr:hypothetical protein [Candidatus Latescibacterota bacterium]
MKWIKKVPLWIVVAIAIFGYVKYTQGQMDGLRSELAETRFSYDSVVVVDSVTVARLAQRDIEKDSLADALEIEKELGAELIAAAIIHVDPEPAPAETIPVLVEVLSDSTRIGHVVDTTTSGVLTATITAPPCCAALDLAYVFDPAPLELTVAVLRVAPEMAVFAVRYRGGETEIEAPFARLPAPQKRLIPYVGAYYELGQAKWAVKGGMNLRMFWGLYGFVEGSQRVTEGVPALTAGFTKEF